VAVGTWSKPKPLTRYRCTIAGGPSRA
jgi:hypothetical protein